MLTKTFSLLCLLSTLAISSIASDWCDDFEKQVAVIFSMPKMLSNGVENLKAIYDLKKKYAKTSYLRAQHIPELWPYVENAYNQSLQSLVKRNLYSNIPLLDAVISRAKYLLAAQKLTLEETNYVHFLMSKLLTQERKSKKFLLYLEGKCESWLDRQKIFNSDIWFIPIVTNQPQWGLATMNLALLHDIMLIPLALKDVMVHGDNFIPERLMLHDLGHALVMMDRNIFTYAFKKIIGKAIYDSCKELNKNELINFKKSQTALFFISHESLVQFKPNWDNFDDYINREIKNIAREVKIHMKFGWYFDEIMEHIPKTVRTTLLKNAVDRAYETGDREGKIQEFENICFGLNEKHLFFYNEREQEDVVTIYYQLFPESERLSLVTGSHWAFLKERAIFLSGDFILLRYANFKPCYEYSEQICPALYLNAVNASYKELLLWVKQRVGENA